MSCIKNSGTPKSGNKDQTRDFYPYGETKTSSGNISAYQYSGKEEDATGLYYFGARYYDPGIGRWLTCDPAGQLHSPYVYCGNNPMIYVDPDGEWAVWVCAIIGAIFGGISNAITSEKTGVAYIGDILYNFKRIGSLKKTYAR